MLWSVLASPAIAALQNLSVANSQIARQALLKNELALL
jgi:hypothetical protein